MEKKTDKLYEVISRMSSSEKGYVSKYLKGSNPKSNLLELYAYLNKIESYDESILKKKIKNPSIVKNLAVTKKQLFETILKIIRNYHSSKDEYRTLLHLLEDIDFLFEKKMVDECIKMIEKGLSICNDFELYGIKIHFLDWKRRILNTTYYKDNLDSEIIALSEDSRNAIRKIRNIQDLEDKQLLLHNTIFHKKWDKDKALLKNYINDLEAGMNVLGKEFKGMGNREKIAITDILARILFHNGFQDKAFSLLNKNISELEGEVHPLVVDNLQRILLVKLGLSVAGKEKEWEDTLNKIEGLQNKHPILKNINFAEMLVLTYRLQFNYIHGLEFNQEKVKVLENFLEKYSEKVPMSSWMAFHISRYYFSYGKNEDAHVWNLRALNQSKYSIKNFNYICKFYMLMILLELEQYNFIKGALQELRRYLIRKDRLSDFEKALLDFFKKAENNWNKVTHHSLFEEFKEIMKPYEDEVEGVLFYLDIKNWLNAKENNITLAEFKRGLSN